MPIVPQRDQARKLLDSYNSTTAKSASFFSNPYNILNLSKMSFQTTITSASSLNVTITLQASNNYEKDSSDVETGDWVDIPSSDENFTGNTSFIWDNVDTATVAVRQKFVFAAGSAKFQTWAYSKL